MKQMVAAVVLVVFCFAVGAPQRADAGAVDGAIIGAIIGGMAALMAGGPEKKSVEQQKEEIPPVNKSEVPLIKGDRDGSLGTGFQANRQFSEKSLMIYAWQLRF